MQDGKFSFRKYFLILIFLIFIVSGITYFYSTRMLEKSQRSVEDNLDAKVKLVDMEDFYFDLNESLNMDDFFIPRPDFLNENLNKNLVIDGLIKNKFLDENFFKDLWIKKENLFNIDIEKENEKLIDKILEISK
ncbi:hypothetical protein PT136_00215 [Borreliella garinii]|uniref:Uncharacterized protein n=1 Tax=Borreliella garinii PBr TaxID=498743 RepID=B7XTD4_BORGR|nr:hypothetical protein [Borreliella garinii]EED28846.1 conserved hypothetical protein [Borreliella garinii PBr]EED30153.1 conserved hypothetical protein [Borreliella garinii Far04]KEO62019.1 hypothetical protein DM10_00630 [Borreliella garinii]WNZ66291.1 hypothetical protein PT139_00215 [Borreliella garinii]WNZ67287.1 hypothetical protein PT135_00215 [Borreliella garinii]